MLTQEQIKTYNEEGYVKVEGLFTPEEVEDLGSQEQIKTYNEEGYVKVEGLLKWFRSLANGGRRRLAGGDHGAKNTSPKMNNK